MEYPSPLLIVTNKIIKHGTQANWIDKVSLQTLYCIQWKQWVLTKKKIKNTLLTSIYILTSKNNCLVFSFPCFTLPFPFPPHNTSLFPPPEPDSLFWELCSHLRKELTLDLNISVCFPTNIESPFQSSNAFFVHFWFFLHFISFTDWILSCSTEDHLQP